jgi:glutaconyl-CoA/methylmalonyl-CoA decarboxylase subunit gamma
MHVVLEVDGEEHDLYVAREGDAVKVEVGGETFAAKVGEGGLVTIGDRTFKIELQERAVLVDGREVPFRVADFQAGGAPGAHEGPHRAAKVKPPMPGKIVSVAVKEGDAVKAGQLLLVLEAMKMQNEIVAPSPGTVKKLHAKPGQTVEAKDVLVELE